MLHRFGSSKHDMVKVYSYNILYWYLVYNVWYIQCIYIYKYIHDISRYQLVRRMTCPSTVPFMNRRCLQPGLLWETLTSTLHCCWHWRFSCGCHEDRSRQCHASKRTSLRNLLDFDVTDKCASSICALLWNLFFQRFEAFHPGGPGLVGFGGVGCKKI